MVALAGLLAGCGAATATGGPPPAPTPEATAASVVPVGDVLADPDRFVGQQIAVEGTLEAEGQMPNARFLLHGDAGGRLQVSPWVPPEAIQPPAPGTEPPKTMSGYIGRRLRLHGSLEKVGSDVILVVAEAEELD